VDFEVRRRMLDGLDAAVSPEAILEEMDKGLPKLWVVWQALSLRRERPEAFGPGGGYRPLAAHGDAAEHVVAFARGERAVTVAPRLVLGLAERGGWGDTCVELPEGSWANRMTGESVPGGRVEVARLLERFPVALLA